MTVEVFGPWTASSNRQFAWAAVPFRDRRESPRELTLCKLVNTILEVNPR